MGQNGVQEVDLQSDHQNGFWKRVNRVKTTHMGEEDIEKWHVIFPCLVSFLIKTSCRSAAKRHVVFLFGQNETSFFLEIGYHLHSRNKMSFAGYPVSFSSLKMTCHLLKTMCRFQSPEIQKKKNQNFRIFSRKIIIEFWQNFHKFGHFYENLNFFRVFDILWNFHIYGLIMRISWIS